MTTIPEQCGKWPRLSICFLEQIRKCGVVLIVKSGQQTSAFTRWSLQSICPLEVKSDVRKEWSPHPVMCSCRESNVEVDHIVKLLLRQISCEWKCSNTCEVNPLWWIVCVCFFSTSNHVYRSAFANQGDSVKDGILCSCIWAPYYGCYNVAMEPFSWCCRMRGVHV